MKKYLCILITLLFASGKLYAGYFSDVVAVKAKAAIECSMKVWLDNRPKRGEFEEQSSYDKRVKLWSDGNQKKIESCEMAMKDFREVVGDKIQYSFKVKLGKYDIDKKEYPVYFRRPIISYGTYRGFAYSLVFEGNLLKVSENGPLDYQIRLPLSIEKARKLKYLADEEGYVMAKSTLVVASIRLRDSYKRNYESANWAIEALMNGSNIAKYSTGRGIKHNNEILGFRVDFEKNGEIIFPNI